MESGGKDKIPWAPLTKGGGLTTCSCLDGAFLGSILSNTF